MSKDTASLFKIFENYFTKNCFKSLGSPDYHSIIDICYIDVFLEYPNIIESVPSGKLDQMLLTLSSRSMEDKELDTIFAKMGRYTLMKDGGHKYQRCKDTIQEVIKSKRGIGEIVTYNVIRKEALQTYRLLELIEILEIA